MFNSKRVKDLETKIQVLEKKNKQLKADKKEFNDHLEQLADNSAEVDRRHHRAMAKKDSYIDELEEGNKILQELETSRVQVVTDSIALEAREKMVAAREREHGKFATALKEVQNEAKEEIEAKYQVGYSDGLADGLRKIHEITAEDRKNSMQVAALAAASHTPGAAKQIAKSVADNMMLPSSVDGPEVTEADDADFDG